MSGEPSRSHRDADIGSIGPDNEHDIGPDIGHDIESEKALSSIICELCGKTFPSETSLKMHMVKSHRMGLKGGPLSSSNVEIQAPASPVADLVEMTPEMKKAVEFSRWKERLRQSDPNLFKIFFPEEARKEESVSKELAYLELARLLRQMRQEEEAKSIPAQPVRANNDQPQAQTQQLVQTYEAKISELQKQIESLKEELNKKEIQSLHEKLKEVESKLEKVREESLTNKSELSTLITTASKHIENLGEKLQDFAMAYIFHLVPAEWLEKFQLQAPKEKVVEEEASKGLFEKVNEKWVSET